MALSILERIRRRVLTTDLGRRLLLDPSPLFETTRRFFEGRCGLEIGGPTALFSYKRKLPLYPIVQRVDCCNFSDHTVWEGTLRSGLTFEFDHGRFGRQIIAEGAHLPMVDSGSYDFVLASHCLEHLANPLGAVDEWCRALAPGGVLLLVLPDSRHTFDHRRPVTSFAHLLEDLANGTGEDDRTHLAEILELHDVERDPGVSTIEEFRERARNNLVNRCLHQHVFDQELIRQVMAHAGLTVLAQDELRPHHLICCGRKAGA